MTAQPVEAVFFWPLRIVSNFRSIYRRINGDPIKTYSKDFFQCPGSQQPLLDNVLGFAGNRVTVEYRWPTGSQPNGYWKGAKSRGHLGWPTTAGAPSPWKVGDPDLDPEITVAGDPNKSTSRDADGVFASIQASGTDPWLIAVKLRGEGPILHARTYLGNPPTELEDRSTALLPKIVRDAMRALPLDSAGGAIAIAAALPQRATSIMARIRSALDRGPNVLLIGPPGTGKTVALEDLRAHYSSQILFDPDLWNDAWTSENSGARKSVSVVFHPSYSYENFVAGLVPDAGAGSGFRLQARAGPLLSMAQWASSPGREGLIIIDEFNRGAAAAVFGDTIALLDRDKRSSSSAPGATIERPYPRDAMDVAEEYSAVGGATRVPDAVGLPSSLHIVAAMNSSDRSVAPIDAALRRRFEIIEIGPDYDALAAKLGIPTPNPAVPFTVPDPWTEVGIKEVAVRLLMALNRRIAFVLGKDFLLGQSTLWHVEGADAEALADSLANALDERIVQSLRLTFVDQDDGLAAVLGIPQDATTAHPLGYWEEPQGALALVGQPRLELNAVSQIPGGENKLSAIVALVGG